MSKYSMTIIIPVFNEGENITPMINGLEKQVRARHEVLVVYDFDQDDTLPAARRLRRRYSNLKLLKNQFGQGVLQAVKTGFSRAKGKVIVVMPADLTDDPNVINDMYAKLHNGNDIICATRYSHGGKRLGGDAIKAWLSRLTGLMTPYLLGIPTTDLTNGFKMYRKEVVEQIKIESKEGWVFSMELAIKAHQKGFRIAEVPAVSTNRTHGVSKFKLWKWLPAYLYWYFYGMKNNLL